jgi:hypothetical protein
MGSGDASGGLHHNDLIGLRALRALHDVEFNLVAFTKGLVAILENGTVVNEEIGPILPTDETIPLCIVEPLDDAFALSHEFSGDENFPFLESGSKRLRMDGCSFVVRRTKLQDRIGKFKGILVRS